MYWIIKKNQQLKKAKALAFKLCFSLALLVLSGCASNIVDLNTQAIPHQINQTNNLKALTDYFPSDTFAPQGLEELYGEPLSVDYIPYLNHHNTGQIDGISTYVYDGFKFSVYQVTSTEKALLMDLVITSPIYSLPLGIQVGSSTDDVLAILGIPYDRHKDISIYLRADMTETLLLEIKDKQVVKIMWQFYWD